MPSQTKVTKPKTTTPPLRLFIEKDDYNEDTYYFVLDDIENLLYSYDNFSTKEAAITAAKRLKARLVDIQIVIEKVTKTEEVVG